MAADLIPLLEHYDRLVDSYAEILGKTKAIGERLQRELHAAQVANIGLRGALDMMVKEFAVAEPRAIMEARDGHMSINQLRALRHAGEVLAAYPSPPKE